MKKYFFIVFTRQKKDIKEQIKSEIINNLYEIDFEETKEANDSYIYVFVVKAKDYENTKVLEEKFEYLQKKYDVKLIIQNSKVYDFLYGVTDEIL